METYVQDLKKTVKTGREYVDALTSWSGLNNHKNLTALLKELNTRTDDLKTLAVGVK